MKVSIDYDRCISSGTCTDICPEVFEIRSDGFLYVLQEAPPDDLRVRLLEAAELCPTGAITLEG